MDPLFGELAALSTAFCWSFGSIFFTIGGSRIGSVNVNRGRLIVAAIFLSIAHLFITGHLLPIDFEFQRWFWFGLSGLVGFVIGDAMLFEAFVIVGPRLSMLLMSLAPIVGTIWGWLFFKESLSAIEVAAIFMTICGIAWVVVDKQKNMINIHARNFVLGILLGVGGALGQAFGLILSKKGLEGGFPALSGNLIRVLSAMIIIWLITLFGNKAKSTIQSYKDKKAVLLFSAGAFFGPFVGVWFSLVAIKYAKLGIATTLMSLTPVFLIPISRIVFKERITIGAIFGTIIAMTGVAILLLAG